MADVIRQAALAMLMASCTVGLATASPAAAAKSTIVRRGATRVRLNAFGGRMPSSFDVWPEDPCAGPWQLTLPNGAGLTAMFARLDDLPFVHVEGSPSLMENATTIRLAANSLRFTVRDMVFTMTCLPGGASLDAAVSDADGVHHVPVKAVPALP